VTINIAVLTSEALVLSCDSIASVTEYFVDPFTCPSQRTEDGSLNVTVTAADIIPQVTNTWDGVTKLFLLQGGSCPVAAVTAGLAKLNNRSMSSYANQFLSEHGGAAPVEAPGTTSTLVGPQCVKPVLHTVEDVAHEFLAFMREHYDTHYEDSKVPEEYRHGPKFLVGGYDREGHLPSLYRVNVQGDVVRRVYAAGRFGLAWEGQSEAVERLIRGYDSVLRDSIETRVAAARESVRKTMVDAAASMLQQAVDHAGISLPQDMNPGLPAAPEITIPWDRYRCDIAYGNLPLQDAVDLAAFLVSLQSGKSKFAIGVPTVGGRTHVGVVTRHEGFRMLDEPELRHTHVGFVS
jgi:hypothetical protein